MSETMNRDIEQTSIRELSPDEAEAVGGGSWWPIIATGLGTGLGVGVGAGIVAGGRKLGGKLGGLLGDGGGQHVQGPSSGKGGGKHVRPSGKAKSSIAGWGDGFGSLAQLRRFGRRRKIFACASH
jgi:hypothetical protein